MRPSNSVGGYRIYPSSPGQADAVAIGVAIIGQFNEGMDRLNRERELTQREQQLIDNLDPNSQIARNYQGLITVSNRLWQFALEKQQSLDRAESVGPYTTAQLGQRLIECANHWRQLKHQLEEQG